MHKLHITDNIREGYLRPANFPNIYPGLLLVELQRDRCFSNGLFRFRSCLSSERTLRYGLLVSGRVGLQLALSFWDQLRLWIPFYLGGFLPERDDNQPCLVAGPGRCEPR